MLSRTFTKKGQLVSFYTLNNLLQITLHKYKSPDFSTFPVAVQNGHFLKVKVKCYSKKRMFPIEKYIYFYSMILMIDCKLDRSHSTELVSNEHISITSIKCFSIIIEDIN